MKNLFLILTFAFLLSSCCNDSGNGSLPPATTTGANTVGCLVNGTVLLPHKEGLSSPVNCFYQEYQGERYFTMAFSDNRGVTNTSVNVQTRRIILEAGQTYILNKNFTDDSDFLGGGGGIS